MKRTFSKNQRKTKILFTNAMGSVPSYHSYPISLTPVRRHTGWPIKHGRVFLVPWTKGTCLIVTCTRVQWRTMDKSPNTRYQKNTAMLNRSPCSSLLVSILINSRLYRTRFLNQGTARAKTKNKLMKKSRGKVYSRVCCTIASRIFRTIFWFKNIP